MAWGQPPLLAADLRSQSAEPERSELTPMRWNSDEGVVWLAAACDLLQCARRDTPLRLCSPTINRPASEVTDTLYAGGSVSSDFRPGMAVDEGIKRF